MKLDKFVEMFDEEKVKSGKVAFTFYHGDSGKWNFWSDGDTSRADIIKSIMENPTLAEAEVDVLNDVEIFTTDDTLRIRIWDC